MVDSFKNRRKIAWSAHVAALLFPLLILSTNSDQLGQIAIPFYGYIGIIITAYIAAASYESKDQRKQNAE